MRLREKNPVTIGIVGVVVLAAILAVALNSGALVRAVTSTSYSAAFAEAGGLLAGDEVRIGGLTVGKVKSVDLDLPNRQVVVDFTVEHGPHLGDMTRASIKTATPLGKKFLDIASAGSGELEGGAMIPRDRTNSPYDVAQVLQDLTSTTGRIDTAQLARSLDTLSQTFQYTPPAVRSALDGVSRLSEVIASRDEQLQALLAGARGVTDVLAQRSGQITTLVTDGNALLQELYVRRDSIRALLVNATTLLDQLRGVVADNEKEIGPALDQLQGVLDVLRRNDDAIGKSIHGLKGYATTLGEAVGGGPFFYAYVANLPPTNLLPVLPELLQRGDK